mgnify:CR=1 FL=1
MTTFSDVFTTGGQTQLHKLRMLMQVMAATFKVSLWFALLVFGFLVYLEHPWQDFWLAGVYCKAWFMTNCPPLIANLAPSSLIYLVDGSSQYFTDTMIMSSKYLHEQMQYFMFSGIKKLIQAMLVGIIGSSLVSWFWIAMGKKKKATKVLSGFALVDAKLLTKRIFKLGASSYTIANVPMPKNAEFQHMMVTGTTGSGKSNAIHQLLSQIRSNGEQAIIVDTTGSIFARFYEEGQDILLNPLDARGKNWNLWEEAIRDDSVCDYVLDEIAASFVPDNYQQGGQHDAFWINSARQVFVESVSYLIKHRQKTYQALMEMTLTMPLKELSQRLQDTSVAAIVDPIIDKTALSVRASLANSLKILSVLEDADDGIALLNLMPTDHQTWLFLSCLPDQREFLKPLFSSQLSLIIKGMMRRSTQNPSRTWLIIDELASLNKLPALLTGLAEIRKYGGCFVLGFQDLSQLEGIYGVSATKTLSNLTGTKLLFRSLDTDVATRMARYLGEQEKQEAHESISFGAHQMRDGVSLSNQKHTKPVVTASQIMMLGDLEAYLKFPQNLPVAKVKFDYSNIASQTVGFVQKPIKPRILKHQAKPLVTESTADSALPIIAPIPMPVEDFIDQEKIITDTVTGNQTNHQSTLPESEQPKIPPINLVL